MVFVRSPSGSRSAWNSKRIYVAFADDEEVGDWLHRAVSLESAVAITPNDTTLRFRMAHAFAQAGVNDVALLHYRATLRADESDADAQNNIGVAYENLDMPIQATNYFRSAAENGNTLEHANIANRFLNAGFVDEARALLDAASAFENPHQNLASHRAHQHTAGAGAEYRTDCHRRSDEARIHLPRQPHKLPKSDPPQLTGYYGLSSNGDHCNDRTQGPPVFTSSGRPDRPHLPPSGA